MTIESDGVLFLCLAFVSFWLGFINTFIIFWCIAIHLCCTGHVVLRILARAFNNNSAREPVCQSGEETVISRHTYVYGCLFREQKLVELIYDFYLNVISVLY